MEAYILAIALFILFGLIIYAPNFLRKFRQRSYKQNKIYKLKPLPDSLFRDKPKGWSPNPNLYNGVELSLHNNDNTLPNDSTSFDKKYACPLCDGFITKKHNPLSKMSFYNCSNFPDCRYETMDSYYIKFLTVLDSPENS